ncbi:hypothetical protein ACFFX0_03025 [Citricoccus parietis]|uniref:Uncharacterized protein n=1 Tax=Citricoccus parietis TaxID=592307 RepID=A0ABV5FU68_9MICC
MLTRSVRRWNRPLCSRTAKASCTRCGGTLAMRASSAAEVRPSRPKTSTITASNSAGTVRGARARGPAARGIDWTSDSSSSRMVHSSATRSTPVRIWVRICLTCGMDGRSSSRNSVSSRSVAAPTVTTRDSPDATMSIVVAAGIGLSRPTACFT